MAVKIVPFVLVLLGGLASLVGAVHQKRAASDFRLMRDTDGVPYYDDKVGSSWSFWLIVAGVVLGLAASLWSLLQ